MTQKLLDILMVKDVKLAFETIYDFVINRSYQAGLAKQLRLALKETRDEADVLDIPVIKSKIVSIV